MRFHNPVTNLFRNNDAKACKQVHGALLKVDVPLVQEGKEFSAWWMFWAFLGCLFLMTIATCNSAHAYTDNQIANAIRKAEGTWTYGIKTIKCETEEDCRKICLRTIKNNRIRYEKDVKRSAENYLSYLSRRYAPIGAGNDPTGLNRNWLRNVEYFLAKGNV